MPRCWRETGAHRAARGGAHHKPGALTRLGIYLARGRPTRAVVAHSEGMEPSILATARESLSRHGIDVSVVHDIPEASAECALGLFADLPKGNRAVIGLGGGKALDVAKYLASLADLPGIAVPTSLSNDGFCSPQASLTLKGRRHPFRTGLPHAVIVDLDVCRRAPRPLWQRECWPEIEQMIRSDEALCSCFAE